jgi:hypothetical protein
MRFSDAARVLGRRGGRARALGLRPSERRRIAALGGSARKRSFELARRVDENFRYVRAVDALRGRANIVARTSNPTRRLPGIYPST